MIVQAIDIADEVSSSKRRICHRIEVRNLEAMAIA
jgi:hypothetical protein